MRRRYEPLAFADFDDERQRGQIVFGQRRDLEVGVRQVDALLRSELDPVDTGLGDFDDEFLGLDRDDVATDLAVVEPDVVALLDVVEDLRERASDAVGPAGERVARVEGAGEVDLITDAHEVVALGGREGANNRRVVAHLQLESGDEVGRAFHLAEDDGPAQLVVDLADDDGAVGVSGVDETDLVAGLPGAKPSDRTDGDVRGGPRRGLRVEAAEPDHGRHLGTAEFVACGAHLEDLRTLGDRAGAELGAREIHGDAGAREILARRARIGFSQIADHRLPLRRVVVGAVDAGDVGAGIDHVADEAVVRRSLRRHRDHDA